MLLSGSPGFFNWYFYLLITLKREKRQVYTVHTARYFYHILDMTLVSVLPLEAGDSPEEHDSYIGQYMCIIYETLKPYILW